MAKHERVNRVQKKGRLSLSNQAKKGNFSGGLHSLIMQRAKLAPQSLTPDEINQLQKTIGNRAVSQLMTDTGFAHEDYGLSPRPQSSENIIASAGAAPVQCLTNPYTAEELGFPPPVPVAFPMQVIQNIIYQRAPITGAVTAQVAGHPDNEPGYANNKHYIPHQRIIDNLINSLVGNTRTTIVANVSAILAALALPLPVGLIPLMCRAHFDTWLDDAFVTIADNHNIIFRGPSTGDHNGTTLDNPAGGMNSAAQIARMAPFLANYTVLNLWP